MKVKPCNKCKKELPVNTDYFHKNSSRKDGVSGICKECSGGRYTRFLELKEGEMFCTKCKEILPFNEEYFPIDKSANGGFRKTCHVCNGRQKGYGAKREFKFKEYREDGIYNKKPTIEEVREFCESIGGKCLEDEYINSRAKMMFECPDCKEPFQRTYVDYKGEKRYRCSPCTRKEMSRRIKEQNNPIFIQEVEDLCEEYGLVWANRNFTSPSEPLDFICTNCKEIFHRSLHVLRETSNTVCNPCTRKEIAKNRAYTYEEVKSIFEESGCYLISDTYTNNKVPLEYICLCGKKDFKALANFMGGQRCKSCAQETIANKLRTPYEEVKQYFEDHGCELLSTEFIHSNAPLEYRCVCGEESTTVLGRFKYSAHKRCFKCAAKLGAEKTKGDKHPNWRHDLTEEERISRRLSYENKTWRSAVYERDNYQCQCCLINGNGNLNAHHKDGYNWCIDRRYDIENGITLCSDCHTEFHVTYGYGDNTEEQWDEFYNNTVERRLNMSE